MPTDRNLGGGANVPSFSHLIRINEDTLSFAYAVCGPVGLADRSIVDGLLDWVPGLLQLWRRGTQSATNNNNNNNNNNNRDQEIGIGSLGIFTTEVKKFKKKNNNNNNNNNNNGLTDLYSAFRSEDTEAFDYFSPLTDTLKLRSNGPQYGDWYTGP